jgi:endonuclease/exonuclease/phosphatase family metal-dependent hydrolase
LKQPNEQVARTYLLPESRWPSNPQVLPAALPALAQGSPRACNTNRKPSQMPRFPLHLILHCLALMVTVHGAYAPPRTAQAAEPLQVISYNIRYQNPGDGADIWANRRTTVAETLRSADVIGLQEVLASQLTDMQQDLPEFEFYGVGRDDGQQRGEMVPLGVRKERLKILDSGTFWLSENPAAVGIRGWDAALPRIASWLKVEDRATAQPWLIVNTHFDHRGPQAREGSGKQLRQWIHEHRADLPALLIGDFNARLSDPPLQALISSETDSPAPAMQVTRDVAKTADTGPDSTWNGFQRIQPGQRIDHILFSGPIQVDSFSTLDPRTPAGRFGSDHLPIQTSVRLAQP